MIRLYFTSGVHGVMIGEVLVLLDLREDAYLCLPHAGGCVVRDDEIECSEDVSADLLADGLAGAVRRARPYEVRCLPVEPARDVQDDVRRSIGTGFVDLAWIWTRLALRRPTLLQLTERLEGRSCGRQDPQALKLEAERFHQARPYFPWGGQCLFQSWWLLEHLQARGLDATWVFAVRIWPFGAHCWLQEGDLCLTDPPETLAAYRPILAI